MSLINSSQLCWVTQGLSSYIFLSKSSIPEMFSWEGGVALGWLEKTGEGAGFYVAFVYLCRVMPAVLTLGVPTLLADHRAESLLTPPEAAS